MMDRRQFVSILAGATLPLSRDRRGPSPSAGAVVRPWRAVQRLLDGYVAAQKIAGVVVGVSYGGEPFAFPAAGKIAFDSPVAFDEQSICRVYSMTKPVTGVAAMMLVEAGQLRLDEPVTDVIPEFRGLRVLVDLKTSLESRPATRTMTMRHLLTHTAGFAYWTPFRGTDLLSAAYREHGITPGNYGAGLKRAGYGPQANGLDDMIKRLAELPLAAEPGTVWRYSVGLDVMGLIVERVSGKPLDEFCRARIFEPLEMTSTSFQVSAAQAPRLTTNYNVTPDGLTPGDARETSVWLKPPTLLAGGAGLVSTTHDFMRFGAMLLGDGELDGTRVMRVETTRLARSNLLPPGVQYEDGGFGAGMRVASGGKTSRDRPGTMSWAGAAGTLFLVDPARRGNLVFMSQYMPPTIYPILTEVVDAVDADLA